MSLFENEEYQWRETYFILFRDENQPDAEIVKAALEAIDPRFQIRDLRSDEQQRLESLTLEAPDDYSAMDVSLVRGDEVVEQTTEIMEELLKGATDASERQQIEKLTECRCRFDVYHFEQLVFVGSSEGDDINEEFLDPGAVLTVMEKIAELCQGIVVDPQANSLI